MQNESSSNRENSRHEEMLSNSEHFLTINIIPKKFFKGTTNSNPARSLAADQEAGHIHEMQDMGDSSLMMHGAHHHSGIAAKEEKDESDLSSYAPPMSTHELMGSSALGLPLHESGEDEDMDKHPFAPQTAFQEPVPHDNGKPHTTHQDQTQPETAIPRLMQMQMEKYHNTIYNVS